MKRLLVLILVILIGYFAYQWYRTMTFEGQTFYPGRLTQYTSSLKSGDLFNVLGSTTSNLFVKGTDVLNQATKGQAEPVINKVVSDLQDRVKSLPAEEYKRVKYEFCRDVMPSPVGGIK